MTAPLDDFLAGANGLLAAQDAHFAEWRQCPPTRGAIRIDLDIGPQADKAQVLADFARAFDMPRWFGHNWDALADCLVDLDWLPPGNVILLLEGDMRDADDARMLVSILRDACSAWEQAGRGFHGLIDRRLLVHG